MSQHWNSCLWFWLVDHMSPLCSKYSPWREPSTAVLRWAVHRMASASDGHRLVSFTLVPATCGCRNSWWCWLHRAESCRAKHRLREKPNTVEKNSAAECQLPELSEQSQAKVPESLRVRCYLLPSGRNLAYWGHAIEGDTGTCFLFSMHSGHYYSK